MDQDIEPDSLKQMQERRGKWAAYQNAALDSTNIGHMQFLQYGEGRTYKEPPKHMPDTAFGPGWKYRFVGFVNITAGTVVREEPKDGSQQAT